MESLNKKKNALDFAMFLKEIGYSSTARAQDFEWLFDYPSTRPFLKFLASSISSSKNVLSSDEVSQYDAILFYNYCYNDLFEEIVNSPPHSPSTFHAAAVEAFRQRTTKRCLLSSCTFVRQCRGSRVFSQGAELEEALLRLDRLDDDAEQESEAELLRYLHLLEDQR
jgi:hypothetical protein